MKGTCTPCPEDCKTCLDSTTCDTCYSNYALDPVDNRCRRCHPTCEECSEAANAEKCSSCYFDAELDAEKCVCDSPLYRDTATWKCVDTCYTGFAPGATDCEISGDSAFEFEFTAAVPQDSNGVIADHCDPPIVIDQRGGYFDGVKSSIEVTNF